MVQFERHPELEFEELIVTTRSPSLQARVGRAIHTVAVASEREQGEAMCLPGTLRVESKPEGLAMQVNESRVGEVKHEYAFAAIIEVRACEVKVKLELGIWWIGASAKYEAEQAYAQAKQAACLMVAVKRS